MKRKNLYNHALKHPDYIAMVHDANNGKMTRPQIARKYKTSEAHVISIFGKMRKEGIEIRRFSWDHKREQMRIAIKTLKAEQKAERDREAAEAARQLKLEQSKPSGAGGGNGAVGGWGTGGSSFDEREGEWNKTP